VIDVSLKYGAIKKSFAAADLLNPAVRPVTGTKS
jgi:hypothetical protein